ncbi:hypothetical protein SBV1_2980016 [Verrucomicrobia bacterium]|nr:hypothetical protein SBV1_2980016 [Verrucomicrobiota bacterium]
MLVVEKSKMPTLTIQLAGLPPVSHVLKDETITIGRMKGNTIVVDDSSISLSHAKITRKNGEFFLKDLNSTNGTMVNGQVISEARLNDLDRVRFADISAQFLQADAPVPAVASAPVARDVASSLPSQAGAPTVPAFPVASPTTAPQGAPKPARAPAPVPPARPKAPQPSRSGNAHGLATRLVAYAGVLAALAVVTAVGWRMLHLGPVAEAKNSSPAPPSAQVASKIVPAPTDIAPKEVPKSNALVQTADAAPAAKDEIAKLVTALKSENVAERRRAATALHSLGPDAKDALPALRGALHDADPEVRTWAALTVVNDKCYDKDTIPILVGALQHENPMLRQVACLSLGLMPYEEGEKDIVVPALAATAAKDGDEDVRKAAVSALDIIAPDALAKAGVK